MLSTRLLLPKRLLASVGHSQKQSTFFQSTNAPTNAATNVPTNAASQMLRIGGTGDPYKTTIKRKNELVDPNRPKFIYNEAMESLKWANWHTLKDVKKRFIASEYHPSRLCLSYVFRYKSLPYELREHALNVVTKEMPRKSRWRSGHLRYHCILTGRPRGRVMQYRVSRFWFRHLADYNKLSGVIKAKW